MGDARRFACQSPPQVIGKAAAVQDRRAHLPTSPHAAVSASVCWHYIMASGGIEKSTRRCTPQNTSAILARRAIGPYEVVSRGPAYRSSEGANSFALW